MEAPTPIDLLFGGLDQLGPGSDELTRAALERLPLASPRQIVDAGCGAGRQTLVLARELATPVDALDACPSFLTRLAERAATAGLGHLVRPHHLQMEDLPAAFCDVDLIWCEGAIYNVGFQQGLERFAATLRPGGLAAVSECTWLVARPPAIARDFWSAAYPAMTSVSENCRLAAAAGFRILDTMIMPRSCWVDGYYEVLGPRAASLAGHKDPEVRALAAGVLQEMEVFARAGESYGYVFYLLQQQG